ncbi:MAG: hypothetical protein ACE15E_08090 [Acidobacteriota bacterium]
MNPRQYSLFLALALVAGFASGAVATWVFKSRVITAEEFRLVDSSGKIRAVLANSSPWSNAAPPSDHVGLTLYDDAGLVRVQLAWEERESGEGSVIGMAALELRNRAGISQSSVQLAEHQYFSNASVTVTDGAGKITWLHPGAVDLSGPGASIALGQPQKEPDLRLFLEGKESRARLVLLDRPQTGVSVPALEVRDGEGKTTWRAP